MIKVLANSVEQAREIAEAFRDSKTDVLIDIKKIKNTTVGKNIVFSPSYDLELSKVSSEIIGILLKHKLNHLSVIETLKITEKTMSERSYHLTLKREY